MTVAVRSAVGFLFLTVTTSSLLLAAEAAPTETLTFEKHIRPIFRKHCFDCHGATEKLKGQLDLRLVRFLKKGGESGPAVISGKPDDSYLLDRITSGEMPPGETRLSDREIEIIQRWIGLGTPTARPEPDSIAPGLGITSEERAFWSFQPIRRPSIKVPASDSRARSPIDVLLLQAMPDGLAFLKDASRLTLIKRAYIDLTGLPPSPKEIDRLIRSTSTDWYEQLIDELLKSPHYGERWARHWLDVAGYADSEGYTVKDEIRLWAWKYRDYVVRSLNSDKSFDRFIIEQLAGDELAGPRSGDWTDQQIELLTATGFLRMAADGTGSGTNTAESRNRVMSDTLKIVSSSLFGLSLACAQCHNHRYDPIPQTDYYALRAIFEPALDWQKWQTPQQRRISLYTASDRKRATEIEAEAAKIITAKKSKQTEYMAQALEKELEKYEQPLRDQLRTAYKTSGNKRNAKQKALLKKHPSVNISPGVLYQYLPKAAEELKQFDKRIAAVRAKKKPEEFLRVLTEPPGHAPKTRLFDRGDYRQPKQDVAPAGLRVVSPEGQRISILSNNADSPTTGRRLAYAKWLTSGRHPLVARVLVNRIWMHHFGRAIVATPGDFGRLGMAPTHPELLDWLADEFVRTGWSLKKLHRTIMLSTVFRQTSSPNDTMSAIDPENRFYWRKPIIRLEAETIRDRALAASGVLDRKLFGPPLALKEDDSGQVVVAGGQKRRSLYIRVRRSRPVAMLQAFDAPVMVTNCESRPTSTVATQSLMMMNGEFILGQAAKLAERVSREAPPLTDDSAIAFPKLPALAVSAWQFGYGRYDEAKKRTVSFAKLPHWTGSSWQGGPKLPDPKHGWVLLRADGGHPGNDEHFAAIRRWTAAEKGTVSITGKLQHGTSKGNGIRGRIVSSRSGVAGQWIVHNRQEQTTVMKLAVQPGDTIDLIADCLGDVGFDSFSWTVNLEHKSSGTSNTWNSVAGFHGPVPSAYAALPIQAAFAWELALCRKPTADELNLLVAFIAKQLNFITQHPQQLPKGVTADRQVIVNLCQVLLSSNEFLYIE